MLLLIPLLCLSAFSVFSPLLLSTFVHLFLLLTVASTLSLCNPCLPTLVILPYPLSTHSPLSYPIPHTSPHLCVALILASNIGSGHGLSYANDSDLDLDLSLLSLAKMASYHPPPAAPPQNTPHTYLASP